VPDKDRDDASPADDAGASGAGAGPATASSGSVEIPDSRGKRLADAAKDALDVGVTKLGSGIGTLGEGVSKLGEGVSKLKVPVVGSGVAKIGEGITQVGESLHELPRVARTRRGRLLIRSMVVGFVLVAAWIVVIVALQLHGNDTPDFRPYAERILVGLSRGAIDEIYEQASPRFQEMVRKEQFSDNMTDMAETVGAFREITAVNDSLVTTGATGRIGRVSLTVAYEKAICKVSVSLHADRSRWKLLGIGVELPPELKISQSQREQRVKACADPMDIKQCDIHRDADAILQQIRDGRTDQVWEAATPVFQMLEQKAKFVQLQHEHHFVLGSYRRIIAVTEAKMIGGTSATLDALAEFDRASGVRTVFGFERRSRLDAWKLASFKIVLPMPRGSELPLPEDPAAGPPDPGAAPTPAPAAPTAQPTAPASQTGAAERAPRAATPPSSATPLGVRAK
jgi:X-X-X-Leu-X-X-Gly heptad repeat protein